MASYSQNLLPNLNCRKADIQTKECYSQNANQERSKHILPAKQNWNHLKAVCMLWNKQIIISLFITSNTDVWPSSFITEVIALIAHWNFECSVESTCMLGTAVSFRKSCHAALTFMPIKLNITFSFPNFYGKTFKLLNNTIDWDIILFTYDFNGHSFPFWSLSLITRFLY